ncbi:MAG: hypothetical protein HQM08_22195 [Candidatus Riflebacteria bacterium]|nr:hypothetical protein [Candidatus Riflebacteria bacterium]
MLDQSIIAWFQNWLVEMKLNEITLHDKEFGSEEFINPREPINEEVSSTEKFAS